MRLLDQPLAKEAAVLSNKAALQRMLLGVGSGAVAGGLGELALTGDLSLKGPAAGAVVGGGIQAAVDPKIKAKIKAMWDARKDEEKPEEPKTAEYYAKKREAEKAAKAAKAREELWILNKAGEYEEAARAGKLGGLSEEQMQLVANVVKRAELIAQKENLGRMHDRLREMQNDPKFAEAMDQAVEGNLMDYQMSKLPWADKYVRPPDDTTEAAAKYSVLYEDKFGRKPEPWEIKRFSNAARAGLDVNDDKALESYWGGTHWTSGDELESYEKDFQDEMQVAGPLALKLPLLNKIPVDKVLPKGVRGWGELSKALGKDPTKAARKSLGEGWVRRLLPNTKKRVAQKLQKRFGEKAARKYLSRADWTSKAARRGPGLLLGAALDLNELRYDPKTGKKIALKDYLTKPIESLKATGGNIANADELYEMRERYGKQAFNPFTKMLGMDPADRNLLYNMGAGGIEGLFNQGVVPAVAAKRINDTGMGAMKDMVHQARWGVNSKANSKRDQMKWMMRGHGDKMHRIPKGPHGEARQFRVADYYSPAEWTALMSKGYKPYIQDGIGKWVKGGYYTQLAPGTREVYSLKSKR